MKSAFLKMFAMRICFAIALSVYASTAQAQAMASMLISIEVEDVRLDSLFRKIEKQVSANFLYSPTLIRSERKVGGKFSQVPLNSLLRSVLLPLGLTHRIQNNQIIVTRILPSS